MECINEGVQRGEEYVYIYAFNRHLFKATCIAFTVYIWSCIPWDSNPWPWHCYSHAMLFELQKCFAILYIIITIVMLELNILNITLINFHIHEFYAVSLHQSLKGGKGCKTAVCLHKKGLGMEIGSFPQGLWPVLDDNWKWCKNSGLLQTQVISQRKWLAFGLSFECLYN